MRKTLGVLLISLFLVPSVSWALPSLCTPEIRYVKKPDIEFSTMKPDTWSIKRTPEGIAAKRIKVPKQALPCKIKAHPRTSKVIYVCNETRYQNEEYIVHDTLIADMTTGKFHAHLWSTIDAISFSFGNCVNF